MSFLFRMCLLIGLLTLAIGSPVKLTAAEEATRSFPVQKCRFTLPGPDWTWSDLEVRNVLFMARNPKAFVINLTTVKTPDPVQMNEQFAKGFEKEFYKPGQITKRAGRFVTFRGLPTYQAESILDDGRTGVTRIFTAHGFMYHLTLLGAKEPIEDDPAFETIMQGFEFTTPPKQDPKHTDSGAAQTPVEPVSQLPPATDTVYGKTLNISEWMGRIAGVCIIGAIVLLLFRWVFSKRKTNKT